MNGVRRPRQTARQGALESIWAEVSGSRVHVWVAKGGTAGAAPVALLHGVVSSRYLLPTAQYLARSRRVAAVDLPGFGRSPSGRPPLGIGELAEVAGAALAAVGVERPIVAGHSIGAQVAVELARRHPAAVRGAGARWADRKSDGAHRARPLGSLAGHRPSRAPGLQCPCRA